MCSTASCIACFAFGDGPQAFSFDASFTMPDASASPSSRATSSMGRPGW